MGKYLSNIYSTFYIYNIIKDNKMKIIKSKTHLQRLYDLAFDIQTKTKHDIFIRYSGHINEFQIDLHVNGWISSVANYHGESCKCKECKKHSKHKVITHEINKYTTLTQFRVIIKELETYLPEGKS